MFINAVTIIINICNTLYIMFINVVTIIINICNELYVIEHWY